MPKGLVSSKADPFVLRDLTPFGNPNGITDTAGRTMVDPRLAAERTIVLLVWGQSNSIGAALGSFYTPASSKVHNLNPSDGAIYRAVEPLLGGGVNGGAWSTRLADALITDNYADRVIIQTIGIGNTSSAFWAAGGYLNHRIGVAAERYLAQGLGAATRTFILRHQGESDTVLGTTQSAYAATLASEIATWRAYFPATPMFIAQASYFNGTTSSAVRAAQAAVVDNSTVFSLGDFDVIPSGNRISNIDYNGAGMAQAALIAKAQVEAYLNTH